MKTFIGTIVAALTAILFMGSSQGGTQPAADLYKAKCSMCHGANGSGDTAMGKRLGIRDLRSDAVQGQTDAQLQEIIRSGKGKMPAQKARLKEEEIQQLVGYIRELAKKR